MEVNQTTIILTDLQARVKVLEDFARTMVPHVMKLTAAVGMLVQPQAGDAHGIQHQEDDFDHDPNHQPGGAEA